jgi:hypothetical protein
VACREVVGLTGRRQLLVWERVNIQQCWGSSKVAPFFLGCAEQSKLSATSVDLNQISRASRERPAQSSRNSTERPAQSSRAYRERPAQRQWKLLDHSVDPNQCGLGLKWDMPRSRWSFRPQLWPWERERARIKGARVQAEWRLLSESTWDEIEWDGPESTWPCRATSRRV